MTGVSYFYETSDGGATGFMEESCFSKFLLSSIYNLPIDFASDDPVRLMVHDTAREWFAFKPLQNGTGAEVECHRFDLRGSPLSKKTYPLIQLSPLISQTLNGHGDTLRDAFLLVQPINAQRLTQYSSNHYREFSRLKKRIAEQIN